MNDAKLDKLFHRTAVARRALNDAQDVYDEAHSALLLAQKAERAAWRALYDRVEQNIIDAAELATWQALYDAGSPGDHQQHDDPDRTSDQNEP